MPMPARCRRARLSACALAAALGLAVHAGAGPAAASEPVPLLWKVSDTDNSVYLLGSFHLLKASDYPLAPEVYAALADAERVLFEIPPDQLESPELMLAMALAARRSDGRTLDAALGPDTASALRRWLDGNGGALAAAGLSADVLQAMDAWFVGLLVTQVEMGKQGLDPALGLDRHIANRAREAAKPTGGLETANAQVAMLEGMSATEQAQMLAEALDTARTAGELRTMHAAWRRGDADALWRQIGADMRARYPQLYRRINVDRNNAWIGQLDAQLRGGGKDDTLAVVGALHLLGRDGVVEQLRARGYTVERVCNGGCAGSGKAAARK